MLLPTRALPLALFLLTVAAPAAHAAVRAKPAAACSAQVAPGADLQQAIDRLPDDQHPAILCMKKGEYPLTQLLHIDRDGVQLRGAGAQTVIRMREDVQQPLIVVGDYLNQQPSRRIRDIVIENLRLIGTTKIEHEFVPERPYLSNSAVVVRAGDNIRLTGLQVSQCRSACLLSEYDTSGLTIERSDVSGATWDGLSFNRTAKVRVIDNYIHDNVAAGITTEHLEDSEIRSNRLERNGSQGVYLADARRNQFIGNQFTGNKSAGVFLACSIRYRTPEILCWDNSMSQDNRFENNTFTGNPYTYTIGVDRAANCKAADFRQNQWHQNQADASGFNPPPEVYGQCVDSQ
jgi:parallel beta-helix repeat protein